MTKAMSTPGESDGITVRTLGVVDLDGEIDGLQGYGLRMRLVTMAPGSVYGPEHDHRGRPGTVYVLEGTITDHRDGSATEYGPGLGWPEDRHTRHWLENAGERTAIEVSVDLVRTS